MCASLTNKSGRMPPKVCSVCHLHNELESQWMGTPQHPHLAWKWANTLLALIKHRSSGKSFILFFSSIFGEMSNFCGVFSASDSHEEGSVELGQKKRRGVFGAKSAGKFPTDDWCSVFLFYFLLFLSHDVFVFIFLLFVTTKVLP